MPWSAAAIVGGGLISSMIGSDSAEDAASQQRAGTEAAIGENRRQFDLIRQDQAPFREAGVASLKRLRDMLNPGGSLDRRFSVADFWADPVTALGYQSGLDLGTRALRNAAPLTTGIDSGAALKELTKFGTDYTSGKAGEAYSRFEGDKTNVFNRLAAMAGIGQTANSVNAAAGMSTGNNIASLLTAQGNANAASHIAQGNAMSGGVTSLSNWWQQQQMLDRMRGTGQSSPTYYTQMGD
jgi:hypothetical protein